MKLTFKQYLEGKKQLYEAIKNTPTIIVEYQIRNYCAISIGESKENSKVVGLKPKQKIIVQWCYNNIDDPSPDYVKLQGVKNIDSDEQLSVFWPGKKMQRWLIRHTKEIDKHDKTI